VISEEMQTDLRQCSTRRRKWWAIQFEDGSYYGEVVDEDGDEGFDLKLFASKRFARDVADAFIEDEPLGYEIVEISWSKSG